MTAVGSYYADRSTWAVEGLGQNSNPQLELAIEMLMELVGRSWISYLKWGTQTGEVTWEDSRASTKYHSYAVSAAQLAQAQVMAFGYPVGFVTIASLKLLPMSAAATLFEGSPYDYFATEAVYPEMDPSPVPRPVFLYWGALRDQAERAGSYQPLELAARKIDGQLLFSMEVAKTGAERRAPSRSIQDVIYSSVQPQPPAPIPPGPIPPGPTPTPPAPQPPSPVPPKPQPAPQPKPSASSVNWWLWIPVGATIGYVTWYYLKKRAR